MALPKLAVLASGEGTNLQAILDEIRRGTIPAQVVTVVSDRAQANALNRARNAGVEAVHLAPKGYPTREAYDEALLGFLRELGVEWVILAGYMRILSPSFVRAYRGRVVNIHPALLPKYRGLHSIERAHENGDRQTGVTVHFVDEGVDTGPVILQETTRIQPGESLESLTERIHRIEHRLYPEAIRKVLKEAG